MESLKSFYKRYEFRRKTVHFLLGTSFVIAINYFNVRKEYLILFLWSTLTLGIILSIHTKFKKTKWIINLLKLFDKPRDIKKFPGRGAIYYLIGILTAITFFERNIASASILILAVGDPIAHVVGRLYGRTKIIVNPKKLLEGTIAGILLGTIVALIFVPFPLAFFGAAFGMMAETIEIKLFHMDDNFFIPLVSGLVMSLLQTLIIL